MNLKEPHAGEGGCYNAEVAIIRLHCNVVITTERSWANMLTSAVAGLITSPLVFIVVLSLESPNRSLLFSYNDKRLMFIDLDCSKGDDNKTFRRC